MTNSLHRHRAFLLALALGLVVASLSGLVGAAWQERVLFGADAFFLAYLFLALRLAQEQSPASLRARAEGSDEGLPLIFLLAAFIIALSLGAIFLTLNRAEGSGPLMLAAALASVPLGWATLHLLAGHHYAALYYRACPGGGDAGGLDFPGGCEPGPWEFIYFAFVVGMTAQVSDAVITRTFLRKAVLLHSVTAFFYNTVILALAVNAAVVLGGRS